MPLVVVSLPNRRQGDPGQALQAGARPDPARIVENLVRNGMVPQSVNLNSFPLNPLARKGSFYAGLDLARAGEVMVRHRSADVVVGSESVMLPLVLLRKAFRFRPKLVVHDVMARGWRARDRVLDFVLPRVDGVLVLSPHQQAEASRTYRLRRPPILVGLHVDEAFYAPQDVETEGYVLSVGDDAGRDYPTLIAACQTLDCPLVLRTGTRVPGSFHRPPRYQARVPLEGLRDLYARATVIAVPLLPLSSPTGISTLIEAMAMGKAIVVSDVGTIKGLLTDGENGLVVPVGDAEAMTAAIRRLLADKELRSRLGRAARQTIEAYWTIPRWAARYASAMAEIAGKGVG